MILPFAGAVNWFLGLLLNLPAPILAFIEVAVILALIAAILKVLIS